MVTIGPIDQSSPSTRFYMSATVTSQSQSGNYSVVTMTLSCYNGPSGTTGSNYAGSGEQSGQLDGISNSKFIKSGNPFLPSGYAANQLRWSVSDTVNVPHNADGTRAAVIVRMMLRYGAVNSDYTTSLSFTKINRQPNQVTGVTLSNITPAGMRVAWSTPGNNGSAITGYDIRYSTNSDYSGGTQISDSATPNDLTGLLPQKKYYVSVRAKNAVGAGPWSATVSATTLPSGPPTLKVATNASGSSATLTFGPPSGVSGVTKYEWERRLNGTTTPVTTGSSTTTTATVAGLVPGNTYDWRATAFIGTYETTASAWVTLKQAKPNTNPGDYFDGASADTPDLDYGWAGAANASISTATAKSVEGWQAAFTSGAGVMSRATAGLYHDFAARVVITIDATGDGNRFGQRGSAPYWTEVTEDVTYVGSIHCLLSRSQSVAAEISWYSDAGGVISRSAGTPSIVPSDAWFRVLCGDVAPAGAKFAAVRLVDVNGAGWSVWRGGDIAELDGAMISLEQQYPYFDGATPFDGDYVYAWTGSANSSTSTRTPVEEASASALLELDSPLLFSGPSSGLRAIVDPDCAVVPAPPRPPSIPSDCIENVGVWRRYYTEIPGELVSDWLDVVPTLEISSGGSAARQVRVRYYPNPDNLPVEAVNTSSWMAEQIVSYMPANTVLTLDGVTQRAWAEVGGGRAQRADHLLYGTNGRPATWPVLSCGIPYLVSVEVPINEPVGNITIEAALTVRT